MTVARIYKCFIASPSDTQEERNICEQIFQEINKLLGEQHNFRVESLKWENDVAPDFGSRAQEVINDQLFKKHQISMFIGIMYSHFGTPTGKYGSGTEEEFYKAYEIHQDCPNSITIKLYFNDAPIKQSEINHQQSQKIAKFKEDITDLGGLYKMYDGTEDFKNKLMQDLLKHFSEIYGNAHNLQHESIKNESTESKQLIRQQLDVNLNDALLNYKNQPITWVDRTLYQIKDVNNPYKHDETIDISNLIENPSSMFIHAQQGFGFTCLAHYLILKAWDCGHFWIYIDIEAQKKTWTQENIERHVARECKRYNKNIESLHCIIIDSWQYGNEGMRKILINLSSMYSDIPVIIMARDSINLASKSININRKFDHIGLLPLSRKNIRTMVEDYNAIMSIEEDNIVLNKIVSDLENLNIHRTPDHCLTLLKIFEKSFSDTPVNRAKMISLILIDLFDFTKYPTYSTKPDVKHCEFVLGYFCEHLIKEAEYLFDKDHFFNFSNSFLKDRKINLDINTVFQILYDNRIIIESGSKFRFKHTFWIHYFAAQRMNQSKDFYNYIVEHENYLSFIEMIEFYTGIDGNQNQLIDVLTSDLRLQCDNIEQETGLKHEFNPLQLLTRLNLENIDERFEYIKKEVVESKLPDAIKDEYADQNYEMTRPNNQDINKFYKNLKFLSLKQKIHVCCRALRNSEFIDPDKKTILFNEIIRGWSLFSKIIFIMSFVMARNDEAYWEGFGFILDSVLKKLPFNKKLLAIWECNINNIINLFGEDLHSDRLFLVLSEKFETNQDPLTQHQLITFLIRKKPEGWMQLVQDYMTSLKKNSFYFQDVHDMLIASYKYDWANSKQIADMKHLIYLWYAREKTDSDSKKLIHTAKLMGRSITLPDRDVED